MERSPGSCREISGKGDKVILFLIKKPPNSGASLFRSIAKPGLEKDV